MTTEDYKLLKEWVTNQVGSHKDALLTALIIKGIETEDYGFDPENYSAPYFRHSGEPLIED